MYRVKKENHKGFYAHLRIRPLWFFNTEQEIIFFSQRITSPKTTQQLIIQQLHDRYHFLDSKHPNHSKQFVIFDEKPLHK